MGQGILYAQALGSAEMPSAPWLPNSHLEQRLPQSNACLAAGSRGKAEAPQVLPTFPAARLDHGASSSAAPLSGTKRMVDLHFSC